MIAVACSVCRKQKVEMRALLGYWRLLEPEGTRSAPRDRNERYKASARGKVQRVLHNAARTGTGLSGVKCQRFEAGSWELGAGRELELNGIGLGIGRLGRNWETQNFGPRWRQGEFR